MPALHSLSVLGLRQIINNLLPKPQFPHLPNRENEISSDGQDVLSSWHSGGFSAYNFPPYPFCLQQMPTSAGRDV